MSLFEKINKKILVEQPETRRKLSDAETQERRIFRQNIEKKAKELKTSPGRLIRDVEKGLQAVDKPATQDLDKFSRGGSSTSNKYNRQAFASGEPFQPDDATTPSGKYPASGKSTLKGRFRYPSLETGKPSIGDVKKRLVSRVTKANIPGIGDDPKKAKEFIDKATKNQPPLSKAKGKESTLYKTLKRDLDLREPTVKGVGKPARFVKGKDGVVRQYGGGRLPMPGDYDKNVDGGRTGTKAQQIEYDKVARKGKKQFDAEIRQQAKLPKSVTVGGKKIDLTTRIPSGTGEIIDPKTGKKTVSNPFSRKELNLQFKADKLEQDYGKRFSQRSGSTPKQSKANLKKLKTDVNIKNPTITSPKSGGRLPATAANLRKHGFEKLKKETEKLKKQQNRYKSTKTSVFGGEGSGISFKDLQKQMEKNAKKSFLKTPEPIKITPLRKPFDPIADPIKPRKIKTKPSLFKRLLNPKNIKKFAKTKPLRKVAIGLGLIGAGMQTYRSLTTPKTKKTTTKPKVTAGGGGKITKITPVDQVIRLDPSINNRN